MKNRGNGTLDIYENVATLKKPLHLVADLIEFFSEEFIEVMIHNDSKETRERLRAIRTAILNDLDKLLNILNVIDPDLVLRWKLGYCDFDKSDSE